MKKRWAAALLVSIILASGMLSTACSQEFDLFKDGDLKVRADLEDLFSLIRKYRDPTRSKERFVVTKQLIDRYSAADLERKKILYLTFIVQEYPDDPFNAYYLAVVAKSHEKLAAPLFAKYYYERIINGYPDLFFGDEYIHKYCLRQLAELAGEPEEKIIFYRELISRFGLSSERAEIRFYLGRAYEAVGEYAAAREMYAQFLRSPAVTIPGFPDAVSRVKEKLAMYEKRPDWIVSDLNELVNKIRDAIKNQDVGELESLRAKEYFFTMTWEQKKDESLNVFTEASMSDYIGAFLLHSQVRVDMKLDLDSSAREAYLRTENWAFQIHPTWYFYFRKVEFGPDPDINGGWEWAGIYFGEKL